MPTLTLQDTQRRAASQILTPDRLPGLAAWYSADYGVLSQVGGGTAFASASSQKLACASNANLQLGGTDFAFSFWTTGGASQRIGGKEGEAGFIISAGSAIQFIAGSASTPTASIGAGYYFVYGEYNATTQKASISVNNAALGTGSAAAGPSSGSGELRWGYGVTPNTQYLQGNIDEITFHKRVLTSDERTWLYNSGAGRTYSEADASMKMSLVSWWSMNAPASGNWLDQHGSNHLTPSASRPTATEGVTFNNAVDGQTVRRWLDRSGNGRHLDQSILLNQPTFSTSGGVKGEVAIRFVAGVANGFSVSPSYLPATLIIASSHQSGINARLGDNQMIFETGGSWVFRKGSDATFGGMDSTVLVGQKPACFQIIQNNCSLRTGGQSLTDTSTNAMPAFTTIFLTTILDRYIPEMIWYDRAITDAEWAKIEKYMLRRHYA